jgi:hypothetical protein
VTRAVLLIVLLVVAVSLAEDGARYLVITTDVLYQSILPLAEWKQATGLSTKVVRLSEIGSDTTSIKNYIRNAYSTWPVPPEYVLLVGSPANLPARRYTVQGSGSYYSDNIYGDMVGDFEAELPVGRFPARSAAQLDVMVAKTLAYERTPDLTDSLWMRRITTVVREGGDADDTIYWNNIRRAASQAGAAGFVRCDSLSYNRGHTASHVVTSVNAGAGMVLYRGTAGGNWYQPFNVDPAQTVNGKKLPIVLSITCETMTLAPNESMVGDAWMKTGTHASLKGAVAFFGNTHSAVSVARQRGAVCRGFFDGLFLENADRLGIAALRAKRQLRVEFPTYTSDYRGFGLLGDPALPVWTATPRLLDVGHPASVEPGPQTLLATVCHNGTPVANALVCASMDTSVCATGCTNPDGEVALEINPTDTGMLRLVVTGRNLYPYDVLIPVVYTSVSEPAGFKPVPRVMVRPSPFRHTATVSVNVAGPGLCFLRIYDAGGRLLHERALEGRSIIGQGFLPGVYFCSIEDEAGRSLTSARFVKLD